MVDFEESGMRFRFAAEKTYYIEKSDVFDKKLNAVGASSVECVTLHGDLVCFIEAKTSAPNPATSMENFSSYVAKIVKKFTDSLMICEAIHGNLWSEEGMGAELKERLYNAPKIHFILIIQKHEKAWSSSLQDCLAKEMRSLLKIWKASVIVLNKEQALDYHLIVPDENEIA
ncbi:MAG TPA: hypothetical protein DDY92_06225 [Dialister sp.]|nr:hypothetical protein [Dialister sp.]